MLKTLLIVSLLTRLASAYTDTQATEFTELYSDAAADQYNASATASWIYNTNLTDYNSLIVNNQSLEDAIFTQIWAVEAKDYQTTNEGISDANMRQIDSIAILGTANLDEDKQQQYNEITTSMDATYSTACAEIDGECKPLDPDLTAIMATSRDYYELKQVWKGWYEAAGRPIRDDYEKFVTLSNEAANADGYEDTGDYWRSWYETANFEQVLEDLWQELKPLYGNLHAYVRRKLHNTYGADFIKLDGPIPAHLLGNMWAQTWSNIYELVEPFPGKQSVDATPAMIDQGWNATTMFLTSEEFFTSLGLEAMTDEFWKNTMFVKPDDGRNVVCHASAWDFYTKTDFRIKMCTVVNMEDLITIHHEMGHIQYFQQYKDQPVPFRNGANPGFHEAVGDTLSLSVSTPKHLEEIGLLSDVVEDEEADINYLLRQALDKIAFLPFGYMIDKWRWSVFDGTTDKAHYQTEWDDLRLQYQGIVPPVQRDPTIDFDPGAKYHIPANTPYIRYFVSFVVQFQFYKAMCDEAGHTEALYKCDFYNSKDAGTKLGNMLKLGSSKPWPDAMQELTGVREMTTAPLQEYFQPLTDWLVEQNEKNGDVLGWENVDWRPKGFLPADTVQDFIDNNNKTGEENYFKQVTAEWNYNTDITTEHETAANEASQATAKWFASEGRTAMKYDPVDIEDVTNKRIIKLLSDEGTGALSDEKLATLTEVNSAMTTQYSTATIDVEGEGTDLELDPDLYEIFATSRDYNVLKEAWLNWRDAVGTPEMRSNYETYVDINNEAARLNNYDDMGAYWRSAYETENFDKLLEDVWEEVLPLYEELHAFVRRRLYNQYGDLVINLNGPIPAHLLGNMWAQDWANIYDLVEPYGGKVRPDATQGLQDQNWDADKMFHVADKFFSDMGLIPVPQAFWDESMIEKPTDKEVVCHASAWDFYNRHDFRIKMCTNVNQGDFVTIHHELGHIQYYLQYQNQHVVFRNGANPGFHEAVGDTLALSVSTLDHMYKLGLIEEPDEDNEADINYLMSIALDKIAFLPFGYLMDKWRWDVFDGSASKANWNQQWWNYRLRLQGMTAPLPRSEDDFDPSAKFHISNNVPYIRYFVSTIIQFQFYEALCNEAGHTGDLYKCDFNGSIAAGQKLSDMLQLGSSVTWEEALTKITGSPDMNPASMIKYFDKLLTYLRAENAKNKDVVGWSEFTWMPPTNTKVEADGKVTLDNSSLLNSPSVLLMALVSILASKFLQL